MLVDTEEERDKLEALIHRYKGMMYCTINNIINDAHPFRKICILFKNCNKH